MAMSKPFNRTFNLADGTKLYEGALQLNRLFTEAATVEERLALIADPAFRDAVRDSVDHPNRDPDAGPTLPPPRLGGAARQPGDASRRTRSSSAARSSTSPTSAACTPPTPSSTSPPSRTSPPSSSGRPRRPEWIEGTKVAQDDPHMIVGTSDGGAHLDRDDGAEAHTWFLQHWVREWEGFTLEEGVRQITAIPAALCGFTDRGPAARRLRRRPHDLRPRHRRPRPEVARPRLPQRRRPLDLAARRACTPPSSTASPSSSTASSRPTPASPARSCAP